MISKDNATSVTQVNYQCYSFLEVFEKIQPLLKDGYRFDLESNQFFPQQFGTVYTFSVLQGEPEKEQDLSAIFDETNTHLFTAEAAKEAFSSITVTPEAKPQGTRRSKFKG